MCKKNQEDKERKTENNHRQEIRDSVPRLLRRQEADLPFKGERDINFMLSGMDIQGVKSCCGTTSLWVPRHL
jgi:hypothetical protein